MLKNSHILLLTVFIFLGLYFTGIPLWTVICLTILLSSGFIAFNIFNIRYTLFVKSLCRIKTKEKIVFLTFDDGPNTETTQEILSILDAHQIKACFFFIGHKVAVNTELVQKLYASGHIIGNHTQTHHWKDTFKSANNYTSLVNNCSNTISKAIGKKPLLFRPPFGITNPLIYKAINRLQLTIIGWNIRSFDTNTNDKNKVLSRIISRLQPGSIILLHDTLPITVDMLPDLIQKIHANGYKILSLQQFTKTYA